MTLRNALAIGCAINLSVVMLALIGRLMEHAWQASTERLFVVAGVSLCGLVLFGSTAAPRTSSGVAS